METKKKAFRNAVQSFEGVLRSQHRVYDGSGEVARTQDVWGAEGISGRVKFLPLAWAGMPKTSFRKNSDSQRKVEEIIFSNDNILEQNELHLQIGFEPGARFADESGGLCLVHDTVDRQWQHLSFFEHSCYLVPARKAIFLKMPYLI